MDVETFLEEYKKRATQSGAQDTLDNLNNLYGTTALYGYKD